MNLYPALKARMGTWEYYVVKMPMKDIVKEVGFASEVYDNKTLDDAIQRTLNEGRVKREIVNYLGRRDDRFFSSIVVASLGGNPKFYPVEITDDPQFSIFRDQGLDSSFGVLTFDGGQQYFALDGQHRLKAIKTLIDQNEANIPDVPEGFLGEEISVIMLVRKEIDDATFLTNYRRLFSSLNRYAKPTDRDTNIIMDEDDAIAIVTRRLLTEHSFFEWKGIASTSPRLKTQGKNLRSGDPYFTTLQTLYGMNEALLRTPTRESEFLDKDYKQYRPSEENLDALFDELTLYWDSILQEIQILNEDPTKMREHSAESPTDDGVMDNLLFWPIGQELFARVVRSLLNRRLPDPNKPTEEEVCAVLTDLSKVNWDLHSPPWRGLLLAQNPGNNAWKMRSEDRKQALEVAQAILRWKVGLDELPGDDENDLKIRWYALLLPRPTKEQVDADWRLI